MAAPPPWAQAVIDKVWETQYDPYPKVNWRTGHRGPFSSGHCRYWTNEIVVTAGKTAPRWEQTMVLLHELAHAISPGGHDERFWLTAWTLYRMFRLPLKKCQEREGPRTGRRQRIATGRGQRCPRVGGVR